MTRPETMHPTIARLIERNLDTMTALPEFITYVADAYPEPNYECHRCERVVIAEDIREHLEEHAA